MRETIATSGAFSQVQLFAPTALQVGNLGDGPNGNLLSIDRVNTKDLFFTDQWSVGKATFNLGLRYDGYDVYMPNQTQLAYTFPSGLSIPRRAARPIPSSARRTSSSGTRSCRASA